MYTIGDMTVPVLHNSTPSGSSLVNFDFLSLTRVAAPQLGKGRLKFDRGHAKSIY